MRILAASVTAANPKVLRSHLQTIQWQQLPKGVSLDLCYVPDPSLSEDSLLALAEAGVRVLEAEPKPPDAHYSIDSETHRWNKPVFAWLARQKQRLLNLAVEERYDAIWMVDSDLLCAPDTLQSLLASDKPIVSATFWTRWTPQAPPLPQCWLSHPYELQGKGLEAYEFLSKLADRQLVRVGGLGACTLIRTGVLDRVGFWPPVPGLPEHSMWQGEDRHFCVRAFRSHIELWADAWPDVWHCYRPEDEEEIDFQLTQGVGQQQPDVPPAIGDLVSLTLEPCEEPALAGYRHHVRGRLGALKMLPDVEAAVLSMRVGDERFISARFPLWHPIAPYRGQKRTIRLRLIGAKPFALAPGLDPDFARNGFDNFYAAGAA